MDDGTDRDGIIALFVSDDQGLLGDPADAHDRRVGLVDDGQSEDSSELAGICHCETGALDVFGLKFLVAGALAEVGDAALQAKKVEIAGVLEDGNDEPPVERDGDTDVDAAVVADIVAFEGSVDDRPLLNGDDSGADEERHEGEADAVALFESVLVFGAQVDDAGEIHFVHAVDVGAGAARLDHALGDDLAHVGYGDEVTGERGRRQAGSRRCGRRRLAPLGGTDECVRPYTSRLRSLALDEGYDVLLGDTAAEAGAGNLREADAVLAGDLADEWGGAGFFIFS